MYKFLLVFGVTLLFFVTFLTTTTLAADDCTIIYGGGEIKCKATISAQEQTTTTPTPAPQNGQTSTPSGTTKGGLPVYTPTQSSATPATGPEAYALITLLPAAALGFYLRNKVK